MTVDNYITALEKIKLALSEVIGALKAEKFKAEREATRSGNSNGVESKTTDKGDSTMFTLKDCKIRIKGNSYEIRFRKFGYEKSFTSTKKKVKKYS